MEHCQRYFIVYGHLDDTKRNIIPPDAPDGAIGIYDGLIDDPDQIISEKQVLGIYKTLSWSWYY
jgi:hypothetical protein